MCGKAYDPRFIYAWPSAKIAVMGGEQAAKTMLQIQVAGMKASGRQVSAEAEQALLSQLKDQYDKQTSAFYAAARLWVDEIIDPLDTRKMISQGIAAANNQPHMAAFNLGLLQV
jgi:3-methylcrotonyl-CoA carboxylase beta subunit